MNDKLVPFPGPRSRRRKCPICSRPPQPESEPFCSKRCRDEDMARWLTGGYRIPTNDLPDPEGGDSGTGNA